MQAVSYVIMNPSLLARSNTNFELCSDNDIWPSRRYETLQLVTVLALVVFVSGLWMNCPFLNVHFIPRVSTFDVLNGGQKGRRRGGAFSSSPMSPGGALRMRSSRFWKQLLSPSLPRSLLPFRSHFLFWAHEIFLFLLLFGLISGFYSYDQIENFGEH